MFGDVSEEITAYIFRNGASIRADRADSSYCVLNSLQVILCNFFNYNTFSSHKTDSVNICVRKKY